MITWIARRGCLRERTLARLAEGVGNARQRLHLAGCARCATRLRAVVRAREVAAAVLRGATLHAATDAGTRAGGVVRWGVSLAAAASLAAVLLAGVRTTPRHAPGAPENTEPTLTLDAVAADAFTVDDGRDWLEANVDDARWEAALRGERPCEQQDPYDNDPRCD